MNRYRNLIILALGVAWLLPDQTQAQPARQMPGTRPFLPSTPPNNFPPANSRVRTAPSQIGLESTDFYPKNGYPKVLGDAVEQGNAQGQAGGAGGASNAGVGGGNASQGNSSGFQGNTGNNIGMNGSTVLGNLFGGFQNITGGVGYNQGGFDPARSGVGLTGGGFTGMVPKGFGFGGTPNLDRSWTSPLNGGTNR
ncbi:MAG: hypothetical protein JNJ77_13760 [Planctomycetia bacterium]|nr:hypothetical protein [Planctomycetia bacterium]